MNDEKMKQKYLDMAMAYASLASEKLPPYTGKTRIGSWWTRDKPTCLEPVDTENGSDVSVDESNEIYERPGGPPGTITEQTSQCMETKVTISGNECPEIPATPSNCQLE